MQQYVGVKRDMDVVGLTLSGPSLDSSRGLMIIVKAWWDDPYNGWGMFGIVSNLNQKVNL